MVTDKLWGLFADVTVCSGISKQMQDRFVKHGLIATLMPLHGVKFW